MFSMANLIAWPHEQREKKNIQESEGVYVFSEVGVPSAQLIRDLERVNGM